MPSAIEITGLVETRRNLEKLAADLTSEDFVSGIREASLLVLRDAREDAPVDKGQLKNSLTAEVTVKNGDEVQGVVGTNVLHGPFMELGTRPHWPPVSALKVWAARHGLNPYLVAKAIATKGVKARKFLQGAFDKNKDKIQQIIGDKVSSIVVKNGGK